MNNKKNNLLDGYKAFRVNRFPKLQADLCELMTGQQPHSLVITCADSRINPHMLFGAAAGELFVLRNIGNRVPEWDCSDSETAAGIEYAVNILQVSQVAVLGHSCCGACAAALNPEETPQELRALHRWANSAAIDQNQVDRWSAHTADTQQCSPAEKIELYNVIQQINRLKRYPGLTARLQKGDIELLGLYLNLQDCSIRRLDQATGLFHQWLTLT